MTTLHRVKSVRIRIFLGPYSTRIRRNKDQKNSECEHFSHNLDLKPLFLVGTVSNTIALMKIVLNS